MNTPTSPPACLLIVDNDALLREALVRRFQRCGMTVLAAADGAEALATATTTRSDVALLDLHMRVDFQAHGT